MCNSFVALHYCVHNNYKSASSRPCAPYAHLSVMVDVFNSNDHIIDVPNSDANAFGCDDLALLSSLPFELSLFNSTSVLAL